MSKWRLPTQEVSNKKELEFYSSEKCEICGRNVFVAVHEGDEDCHTITERLREQGLTIRNCDSRNGKTIIHFDRCIFHVEKINEIWMENHEEYTQWIERREKGEKTEENFTVNWNEEFVKEFWRLIRKYRDVKYNERTDEGRWGILKGKGYDFKEFVFPEFEKPEIDYGEDEDISIAEKDFSFWKRGERFSFQYSVNFSEARFSGNANFWKAQFSGSAYFGEARFLGNAYFIETRFSIYANFREVQFSGNANFWKAQFSGSAYFGEARFLGNAYFGKVQFSSDADFSNVGFHGLTDFTEAHFYGKARFLRMNFKDFVSFRNVKFFGKDVDFAGANFYEFAIFVGVRFGGDVTFREAQICNSSLIFDYSVFNGDIVVFDSVKGNGEIKFDNVTTSTKFLFRNFIVKKCSPASLTIFFPLSTSVVIFSETDLSNYDFVCFRGYVENVKFINVNWGEVNSRRYCPELMRGNPRAARDIYRQLKLALDKQENYIDARKFYALEMEAHGRELFRETNIFLLLILIFIAGGVIFYWISNNLNICSENCYDFLRKVIFGAVILIGIISLFSYTTAKRTFYNIGDLVVYKLYQWTSRFGLSWFRPLLILGFLTFFKSFICGHWIYCSQVFRIPYLDDMARELLSLIPGAKNLLEGSPQGGEFVKLIYYSLVAYLIYQFVMALRRKVRR